MTSIRDMNSDSANPLREVEFRFYRKDAAQVWSWVISQDGKVGVLAMERQADGWWALSMSLSPGEYRFRYLADEQNARRGSRISRPRRGIRQRAVEQRHGRADGNAITAKRAQESTEQEHYRGSPHSGLRTILVSSSARLHGTNPPRAAFFMRAGRGYHVAHAQAAWNDNGTKLAIALVAGGIAVALIAHRFRVFTPPTTRPAATKLATQLR